MGGPFHPLRFRRHWTAARRIVQLSVLLLFLAPLAGPRLFQGTLVSSTVFGVSLSDPLAALQIAAGVRGLGPRLAASAGLVLATYLILGRAYCGWVCPVNIILELIDGLRRRLGWTDRLKLPPGTKYVVLGAVLVLSFAVGLPVFEMVSPPSILLRNLLFGAGPELALVVAVVLYELLAARRGWCRTLCPLGGFYSGLGRMSPVGLQVERSCTGCKLCQRECPMGEWILRKPVEDLGGPVRSGECTLCGECIQVCPRRSIGVRWLGTQRWRSRGVSRRPGALPVKEV